MASIFVTAGQPLRRTLWRGFRGLLEIFHLLPPIAAVAIFVLLANVGQIRELYISYLEERNWWQILFGFLGFGLVSFVIFSSHYYLSVIRENIVYRNYVRPGIGFDFHWVRRWGGLIWAAMPWIGMVWGLWGASEYLARRASELGADPEMRAAAYEGYVLPAVLLVVVAAAVVLVLLFRFRRNRVLRRITIGFIVALFVIAAILPVFPNAAVVGYRWLGPFATLAIEILFVLSLVSLIALLSQRSESPVLTLLAIVFAIGALPFVSLGALTLGFAVICLLFAVLAFLARLWVITGLALLLAFISGASWHRNKILIAKSSLPVQQSTETMTASALAGISVHDAFEKWLNARNDKLVSSAAKNGVRYPVFIVAVEGGGIYAAAAASLFLAKLQDDTANTANFADHVFAISGVSGGAIGAAIFQALVNQSKASKTDVAPPVCGSSSQASPATTVSRTDKISSIMKADYFSPVVAALWPDFLGEEMGRAESLQCSLLASVERVDHAARARLDRSFLNQWSYDSTNDPALVLNTTSAETGYRVAFAPFGLHSPFDSTLYSFSDKSFIDQFSPHPSSAGKSCAQSQGQSPPGSTAKVQNTTPTTGAAANDIGEQPALENIPLISAAVASARFPGIMPPYEVTVNNNRLNFLDGGYSDNSGAETALDIYREITSNPITSNQNCENQNGSQQLAQPPVKSAASQSQVDVTKNVDIKVILLTSDDPKPSFRSAKGTRFGDTVAPVNTLINVRNGLAEQAVARTCDYFYRDEDVDANCNSANTQKDPTNWHLKLVKIEDEAYALPLAWKISDTTFHVVSWPLIGEKTTPDECKNLSFTATNDANASSDSNNVPRDAKANSCVISAIEQTLNNYKNNNKP
jgi:hypothetical protein